MKIKKINEDDYLVENIGKMEKKFLDLEITKDELLELRNLIDKTILDEKKLIKKNI